MNLTRPPRDVSSAKRAMAALQALERAERQFGLAERVHQREPSDRALAERCRARDKRDEAVQRLRAELRALEAWLADAETHR